MIYIGIVITTSLALSVIAAWKTKKSRHQEETFIKGLVGTTFKTERTFMPVAPMSGLSNSVVFSGRLWGVKNKSKIESGQEVRISQASAGILAIESASSQAEKAEVVTLKQQIAAQHYNGASGWG